MQMVMIRSWLSAMIQECVKMPTYSLIVLNLPEGKRKTMDTSMFKGAKVYPYNSVPSDSTHDYRFFICPQEEEWLRDSYTKESINKVDYQQLFDE
jgi:hypothetical protein